MAPQIVDGGRVDSAVGIQRGWIDSHGPYVRAKEKGQGMAEVREKNMHGKKKWGSPVNL